MATNGVLNSDLTVQSAKFESLTVLKQVELQGTLINNAVETTKELLRFEGSSPSSNGAGGTFATGTTPLTVFWDVQTDPSGLESAGVYTCPVDGLYSVSASVTIQTNATGVRFIFLTVNGSVLTGSNDDAVTSNVHRLAVSIIRRFTRGTTLAIQIAQTSGGNLSATQGVIDIHLIRRI